LVGKYFSQKIILVEEIGTKVNNVALAILKRPLIFSCPFARLFWRIVYPIFNISPPTNITNIFGNWLRGIEEKTKARIHIGVSTLCWAIWKCPLFLTRLEFKFFTGYALSCALDTTMTFPPPGGPVGDYGYWM
jgi:hypothetical protein